MFTDCEFNRSTLLINPTFYSFLCKRIKKALRIINFAEFNSQTKFCKNQRPATDFS